MEKRLWEQARKNLHRFWGFSSFRPGQDEVIRAVLEGEDTLVLFPTGGGKSLCYQVPATVLDGLTVVISPLIALMQDQVQQLKEQNIPATFINSTLSHWEVEQRLVNARNGMYDLLYCSPERLKTTLWEAELPKLNIDLIAIDEAHCISEWGHDFRPSYREIRPALESVADSVRWMALTATATPEVRDDIIQNLAFEDPRVISKGFDRPNLKWWVTETQRKKKKLLQAVKRASPRGSGLIYGGTRRNCKELSITITQQLGIQTRAYHAGVDHAERKEIQQQWVEGRLPLVVATSAFGMGIDKADCRYVIHYEMPYSLESYYQQAGRAGRDGEESFPLLLFDPSDSIKAEKRIKDSYPQKKQLQHVYDVLCDELNLAVGSLLEEAQEISIESLKKRSGLSAKTVNSSLRVLQRLGIINLIEYVEPKVGIHFLTSPQNLYAEDNKRQHRKKAAFLDTLYRQYGQKAMEETIYMPLQYITQKLDVASHVLEKSLRVLQDHDGLLRFDMQGEHPLVTLEEERQSTLRLSKKQLEQHRNTLLDKLSFIEAYIETDNCREVFIRNYFGEKDIEPCGHCDNCLNGNAPDVSPDQEDFGALRKLLADETCTVAKISRQLHWKRKRVKYVLSYLLRENLVMEKGETYSWKGEP